MPKLTVQDLKKFNPTAFVDADKSEGSAEIALRTAQDMVDNYCRGNHVTRYGEYRSGIEAVILTVATRLHTNPGQVSNSHTVGELTLAQGPGFKGFTLTELMCLNRYRKRAV